jgi:hypothetical protein
MQTSKRWGGRRKNQTGRPPIRHLKPDEKRRAVWIIATSDEIELINEYLSVDYRKEVLLKAVVDEQNGV